MFWIVVVLYSFLSRYFLLIWFHQWSIGCLASCVCVFFFLQFLLVVGFQSHSIVVGKDAWNDFLFLIYQALFRGPGYTLSWRLFQVHLKSVYHEALGSVQSLRHVRLFVTPWTAAHQASLSITNSQSLLKLMSNELVMPSHNLILCHSLLFPPSIFPSIRVFSSESVLHIRWPKYWSFN